MPPYCVLGDCVTDLVEEIRSWPAANTGCEFPALVSYLTGRLNTPLSEPEVQQAVNWLTKRGLAKFDGACLRLTEPDRPETKLYEPLAKNLNARKFLNQLDVRAGTYVFQDTSTGGTTGSGLLSRPDFTLAAIRVSRFEKALEITTIEVKNRAGTNVKAVFDIRAHRRMSHYPYLACPRSRLNPATMETIRTTCRAEDIGLILFDIEEDGAGGFDIHTVKIDYRPRRTSPERGEPGKYLASRLSAENCARLELIRGA